VKFRFLIASAILIAVIVTVVRAFLPNEPEVLLPQGPQTMSGVLVPASLSLDRRGTHLLRVHGTAQVYVESNRVSLRAFEGLLVTVQGLLEPNIDPSALPVLVASGVTLIMEPMRQWTVEPLQLSFESPLSWDGQSFDDGMRMTRLGDAGPVLQVYRAGMTTLPSGTRLHVGDRSAVMTVEAGGPSVFVQSGTGIIAFSFIAEEEEGALPLSPEQMLVLRSVRFLRSAQSSAPRVPASPLSASGIVMPALPCGGPGGVLCPEGSYCEISDPVEGIGLCRSVR
jgi:hypothetical protein